MDLCINTQTPLLQFSTVIAENGQARYWPDSVDLSELKEGVDYRFSPGGVTRMVLPLVKWLHHHGRVQRHPHLQPQRDGSEPHHRRRHLQRRPTGISRSARPVVAAHFACR